LVRNLKIKIVSVYFNYGSSGVYKRLAKVWEYSLKKNTPDADVELIKVDPPKLKNIRKRSCISNTHKLKIWEDCIEKYNCPILFMDCDILVLGDMLKPFEEDFDIAYTKRSSTLPFNGGVLYTKPTEKTKKFMRLYLEVNNEMLKNPLFHQAYRRKYGGMNQSAFGYLLEKESSQLTIKALPETWNLCEKLDRIPKDTKAIHVKSRLRRVCMSGIKEPNTLQAYRLWNQYEEEAS